jgi:predicted dehydrogenase
MPNDLYCRACDRKAACPESITNTLDRWVSQPVEEAKGSETKDLCVFAKEVDSPDNETCLMQFSDGTFGSYTQTFFTPFSYHHRVYELIGTEAAMEIDLGVEEGQILLCRRYGAVRDKTVFHFDYMGRNHYNGDAGMTRHFYQVILGKEPPQTTVSQAFVAEMVGYAAIRSSEEDAFLSIPSLLPTDLSPLWSRNPYTAPATS